VRRTIAQREIVSVIIAADRAPDRVEACIEALRGRTGCRGDEIICVGNFSGRSAAARRRLDRAADRVLDGREHATWADACNRAAAAARGEYLLFLDPGIEILDPDWLDQLVARARSAEIGAVGPRLLDPARRIRDGGLFVTPASEVRAAFRGSSEDEPGYFGLAQAERNVIAVNGACLLTRRANFAAVDGFVVYPSAVESALDYGLRLRQRGLFNLHMPHVRLVLHADPEPDAVAASAMLARRWRKVFVGGDPYFHPRLATASDGMTPEREPAERIACGHPVLANDKVKRILAVKLDHLGDCVTVLPALRRLKQHFPAARLAVLSGPWARDVWALEPAIDEVIEFSYYFAQSGLGARTVSDGEREKLRRRLRPYRFDLAVDLRKIPDTRPILQLAGARCLAGFEFGGRFPWLDIALEWEPDRALVQKRQHISDDFINLVDAVGAACAPDRHVIVGPAPPVSARVGRLPKSLFTRPLVCVHPAAGGALRQWPPTHFAALIDLLVERQGVNIALIGHGDDRSVTNAVRAKVELKRNVFSLAGKLALADLPALLARAVLFVGNDSGPKHLAAGLGVPTIGIQSGAVDSVEWGPLGPYALAVRRDMACAPCYLQRPEDCPREIACLAGLAVGDVYRACERLLALGRARALNSTAGKPHDMRRSLKRRARHH